MRKIQFWLITFYKFVTIPNPNEEVKKLKNFMSDIGMKGRIYISEEGINAQCSANEGQFHAFKLYLENSEYFQNIPDIEAKKQAIDEHKFPKTIVRYRKEIVSLGKVYTPDEIKKSTHKITIDEFKNVIDNWDDSYAILDMRNNYEFDLGHFKNAIPAGTISFREFKESIEHYKKKLDGKKVVMYCTGGIRCEKLGAMLEEFGMEDVQQLDGGIIKYVNAFNDGNWLGNLYTFDERVSTKVGDSRTHVIISKSHYSDEPAENYYNCRYGPCNAQLIAKPKEYRKHYGFCSEECANKGMEDLLIKNESFDEFNYKEIRGKIKQNPILKEELTAKVKEHVSQALDKVEFKHKVPVPEEYFLA